MKEDIATCLLEYPDLIRTTGKSIIELTEKVEQHRAVIKEMIAIANSKASVNPALKNADQRKTEVDTILAADGDYQDGLVLDQQLTYNLAIERIDLEYLNNLFKAYLALAKMEG